MQLAIVFCAAWLFAIVCWGDLKDRRIPNELSLGVAGLAAIRLLAAGNAVAAGYTLVAGFGVFAIAFLLFSRGLFGGGDAKLVTAVALLVGHSELLQFMLAMSLCGLGLTLLILAEDRARRYLGWSRRLTQPAPALDATASPAYGLTVPYGVAIAAAGLWTLMNQILIG
jgi:prepilin peptidase CpaA